MLGTGFRLDDHLSATATGTRRLFRQFTVCSSGGDGKHFDGTVRILRSGSKQGRPLGTESRWIGCILLITANRHLTILQPYGSADTEVGIGGITATGGFDGLFYQLALSGTEFLHLTFLNDRF